MAVTRAWKVYGAAGHRQRESFRTSTYGCSANAPRENGEFYVLEIINADITGTNDYTILCITRETAKKCEEEFNGQLNDGVFENSRTGDAVEITSLAEIEQYRAELLKRVKGERVKK